MRDVVVLILHRPPGPAAGAPERLVDEARAGLAARHARGFAAAGAAAVRVVEEAGSEAFGARLRRLIAGVPPDAGIVVLGSGSLPLATRRDRAALVAAAAAALPGALANNRYSADVVALAGAGVLARLPDLPGDNALPRWLEEVAGIPVADLRDRWRLAIDVDGPGDLLLPGVASAAGIAGHPPLLDRARTQLAAVVERLADPRAEVIVAGRTSAGTLAGLERGARARIRALVEERGLRAATSLARPSGPPDRPPRSVLGMLLDRDGPGALGTILAQLGDAAVIDTRVLLAHRLGAPESGWPAAPDRYASDLLSPELVADPWLAALTRAAWEAPIPIALGGHTLVGPGLRLLTAGAGGRR